MYEIAHTPDDCLAVISPPTIGGLTKQQHEKAYACCLQLSSQKAQTNYRNDKETIDRLMLDKYSSWKRADFELQRLIITSLKDTPLHKNGTQKMSDDQRRAFVVGLWRLPQE